MKLEITPIGVEFTFDAKISNASERVRFYRELYGGRRSSNFGKYTYIKDGVLSEIKFLKPTRSTLIVSLKDAKLLRNFFKNHKVNFDEKIVLLKEDEAREIGLKYPNNWRRIYEDLKENENLLFTVDF